MSASSAEQAVIETHRAAIAARVKEKLGWSPSSYELDPLVDWDASRVPIIVVNTNRVMTPYAPLFAVLPEGRLISIWDADAFAQVVAASFPEPSAKDAGRIARLATLLGNFGEDVGDLVTDFPLGPPVKPPRPTTDVSYRKEGAAHVVAFYTFDHERMRLHDCEVRLDGKGAHLRQQTLELVQDQD